MPIDVHTAFKRDCSWLGWVQFTLNKNLCGLLGLESVGEWGQAELVDSHQWDFPQLSIGANLDSDLYQQCG